ncbi:MAG: DUF1588 domain-containing protein [Kofleriaceae bacterium]|nr:DUF1588 domain-containing protein [Kofleriaceae bacterium]
MGKVCVRCHTLAGPAAEENARFLLQPPAYPGFLDINFQKATEVALIEIEGTSELLLKPTNAVEHGGGLLFEAGSEEHAILQEFVKRTASPTSCTDQAVPGFDDVAMLDGPQTLRKALLELVGRLPTPAEREAVEAAGPDFEGALDQVLDAAMQEDAFYARMSELWNDVFLTDRFLTFTGRATNLLNTTDWPNAANMGAYWTGLSATDRERTNTAVAREPLELINYIIRNGKPFTDVVTATYTVVNPYSAQIYGVGITFPDPTDTRDWRETQLTVSRDGLTTPWPHAGILSSPMWLNRFPTTATNRNRHRARMVYRDLLATDILAIADRPIDAATATAYLNPTREDPSCKVCHAQIDPIAGSFQKWNANDQEQWQPAANWFPEMYPPGFEGEVIPSSDFVRALPWLGDHIASDPRFSVAITRHLFKGLTGQAPAVYPQPTDASFDAKRTAFLAQEGVLAEIARNFVAANYDLRVAIKGVVHSPYFRADRALGPLTDSRAIELADLGTARLITPERLARKVEAVTGAPWVRYDRRDNLTTDYRIAYGGIDSDAIVERLTTPNGMMSGTSWRMANEVACVTTAWDFSRPPAERNLFPSVAIVDVPEAMGTPSADGAAKIRAGIVHLHQQVLGETLAPDDPEIDRTYDLWLETWREGKAAVTGGQASQTLLSACRARVDPRTGTTLPPEQQIDRDPDYTIRAWMAVLTYLLADYRFLHS